MPMVVEMAIRCYTRWGMEDIVAFGLQRVSVP